jgi:hypothetical protein
MKEWWMLIKFALAVKGVWIKWLCTKVLFIFYSNFLTFLNKFTNYMQQFHKFITWHLCVAEHVSGIAGHGLLTTTNNAATAMLQW